jgi:protein TonB
MSSVPISFSFPSRPPIGLRALAVALVVALHLAVALLLIHASDEPPLASMSEPITVSVIEAAPAAPPPDPTPPTPEPPRPVVEPPPPPVETPPDPPDVKPDPVPDPEPVIEKPPEPAPRPKPQPRPKPRPAPKVAQPTAQPVQPAPAQPVEAPPAPAAPAAAPAGPPSNEPQMVSHLEYAGAPPRLSYPPRSQQLHEQGVVTLRVVVNAQGNVERVTVEKSSGYTRLDQAAVEAVSRVRFKPAQRNGVAMAAQAFIPFNFHL